MTVNSTSRFLDLGGLVYAIACEISKCADDLRLVERAIFESKEGLIEVREVHDLQLLDVVIQVVGEISPVLHEVASVMESGKGHAKLDEAIQGIKLEQLRADLVGADKPKGQAKATRVEIF